MSKLVLFLHFLNLFLLAASGLNTLHPGQYLSVHQTLTSTNGIFQFGFLEYDKCPDYQVFHYCIGIWYNKIPAETLVWSSALGPSPELGTTIYGSLRLSDDGELLVIWSNTSSSDFNSTKLVLEDTGNLVMTSASNTSKVLWQSFDHPTDTWLPGAKLGFNKHTNRGQISPRGFSIELDRKKMNAISLKKDEKRYGTCRVEGSSFTCSLDLGWYTGEDYVFLSRMTNISYVSNENEAYFTYTVTNSTIFTRFMIIDSGFFIQKVWSEDYQGQVPSKLRLSDAYCDQFAVYNKKRDYSHSCKCSSATAPAPAPAPAPSTAKLSALSINKCSRQSMLQCHGGEKEGFLLIYNASITDTGTFLQTSPKACKLACLANCSCTAYNDEARCQIWEENFLGIQSYPGLDVYIRLATTRTRKPKSQVIVTILGAAASGISLIIALAFLIWKCKSTKALHASKAMETSLMVFQYSDLRSATKNFTSKLGEGGFGSVYKGELANSSGSIAVKKLKAHLQGEKQFRAEVRTLGIIHHVNLVQLKGFCLAGTKRFLVYDYMPHGSLDKHLFGGNTMILDWRTRYQIALGIAKGLAYLHDECRECIIHCDIKPENILLDAALNPKLADFGLAKLHDRDFSRVLTTMRGTRGYLAPEWISGIEITAKADVYSYGMMLFEIISGQRNWSLRIGGGDDYTPYQVMQRLTSDGNIMGLLDSKLEGNANTEEFIRTCKVAGWCIQEDEKHRPSTTHMVQILEGISEVNIPPMPRFLQYVADIPEESQNVASLSYWADSGNRTESS